jgi:pSer/pThr/pTyr-binding forkhead associated (FHA) protein
VISVFTLTVIRVAFLCALWLFVILALLVLRRDLKAPRAARSQSTRPAKALRKTKSAAQATAPIPTGVAAAGAGSGVAAASSTPTPTTSEARLVVIEGPLVGTSVPLSGTPVTIGRASDSTLVLEDDYVSSHHARVVAGRRGKWQVEDLGSTNGTYVDDDQIKGSAPLEPGTRVRVGTTVLEMRKPS